MREGEGLDCEEISPYWGDMLGRLSRALTDGFNCGWEKVEYGKWGVPRADLETLGADAAITIHALPPVVEAAYARMGILAQVRVVEQSGAFMGRSL